MTKTEAVPRWALDAAEKLLNEAALVEIFHEGRQGQERIARTILDESPLQEAKELAEMVLGAFWVVEEEANCRLCGTPLIGKVCEHADDCPMLKAEAVLRKLEG